MSGRTYLLPIALATAVGVPYVATESQTQSNDTAHQYQATDVGGTSRQGAATDPLNAPFANTWASPSPASAQPLGAQPWGTQPFGTPHASPQPGALHRGTNPLDPRLGPIVSATPWQPVGGSERTSGVPHFATPPASPGAVVGPNVPQYGPGVGGHWQQQAPAAIWVPGFGWEGQGAWVGDPHHGAGSSTATATGIVAGELGGDLGNIFDFSITPEWVLRRFERVSSEVAEPPLTGLRVAVVTGTSLQDVAGSITYYFDGEQKLQRILFEGTTGDPTGLVQRLAGTYQLTRQPSLSGLTYAAKQKQQKQDRWLHLLQVRYAKVVQHHRPHQRYEILAELNRPNSGSFLSERHATMLDEQLKMMQGAKPK